MKVRMLCSIASGILQETCTRVVWKSVNVSANYYSFDMINDLLLQNLSWVNSIARTFCRNRHDAEDLAGDTILKVLLNADRYDESKSFRLWVLVIMRNTFRIRLRHCGIVETFEQLPDSIVGYDPSQYTIVRESMSIVKECENSSISVQSAVLFAQGYSYSEIAALHGVSINVVKSRVHHGRRLILRRVNT